MFLDDRTDNLRYLRCLAFIISDHRLRLPNRPKDVFSFSSSSRQSRSVYYSTSAMCKVHACTGYASQTVAWPTKFGEAWCFTDEPTLWIYWLDQDSVVQPCPSRSSLGIPRIFPSGSIQLSEAIAMKPRLYSTYTKDADPSIYDPV